MKVRSFIDGCRGFEGVVEVGEEEEEGLGEGDDGGRRRERGELS